MELLNAGRFSGALAVFPQGAENTEEIMHRLRSILNPLVFWVIDNMDISLPFKK